MGLRTATERIVASHSQVQSVGETLFLQMTLRQVSGVQSIESVSPAIIEAAASGVKEKRLNCCSQAAESWVKVGLPG